MSPCPPLAPPCRSARHGEGRARHTLAADRARRPFDWWVIGFNELMNAAAADIPLIERFAEVVEFSPCTRPGPLRGGAPTR